MSIFIRKHSIHTKFYLRVSGGGFFCREGYRRIEKCFSLCSIIPYCFIIPPFTLPVILASNASTASKCITWLASVYYT